MSVIIRLQNLPWAANALDIRHFFRGLNIPEGGVHIVGGELGDAFIAFSTDEDARQAFNLNGGKIKEVQVKLLLSSRTEMQKVIEAARNPLAAFIPRPTPAIPAVLPTAVPAFVPEVMKKMDNKEKDKRDRRRSRSRSRDRKDRSRERDSRERRERRRRDRSRSRSRDRRERRRRDRSRSRDHKSKSKERKQPEEKNTTSNIIQTNSNILQPRSNILQPPVVTQVHKESSKAVVWSNNMPVVQTPTILNTLLPGHLQQSGLLLNYRNGLQTQTNALTRVVNSWNANTLSNQSEKRSFQDDLKAISNIISGNTRNSTVEGEGHTSFTRPGRVSRFDVPGPVPKPPPTPKGPHPLDRLDGTDRSDFSERSNFERTHRSERYERERTIIKDCCIELNPFYGGYGEIRKFFNGLFIHNNGIKFVNDEFGKRTGIVYVRFASPTGKERALERNGMMLRDFSVDLSEITDDTFDAAIDRYHPPSSQEDQQDNCDSNTSVDLSSDCSCLAIEDLPLFTKEQDMLKIFSEYSLQQILLENKQRYLTAYIKFSSPVDAQKAAKERATAHFDNKPLKIRICTDEEYYIASQERDDAVGHFDKDEVKASPSIETDCVSLSGLPKKTTNRDVSDFFSDVAIVPNKIHLIGSNLGFIGQAYCEFPTVQDAQTALQKNGLPLGSGIVKVKSILRSEMEANIGRAIPRDPIVSHPLPTPPLPPHLPSNMESPPDHMSYDAVMEPINYEMPLNDTNYEMHVKNANYEMSTNNTNYDEHTEDRNYERSPTNRNYERSPDRNYEQAPINRNYEMSPMDRNYERSMDRNYKMSPTDRNYEMTPTDRDYEMSPTNMDYEIPPTNINYEMAENENNYEPNVGRRIYEEPIDERNYEQSFNVRKYEQPANVRNYEPRPDSRNYEPVSDTRDFGPPHSMRRYEQAPDSRNYDPRSNMRHYDAPHLSRPKPPPLMALGRRLPRKLPPVNAPDMGGPGCTLLMENVPYKAGLDEILCFFEGFDILEDNVLRRYNDNGTPSGEAKVIFNSNEEAYQALQECNLRTLRDRTVYLSQC